MTQRVQTVLLNLLAVALFLFAAVPAKAEVPALKPGDIVTIAGQNIRDNGPATLGRLGTNFSKGIAKDAAGNLYISDAAHHRIRKVDAATGIITTVVGNGSWGFGGDGGLAVGAMLNNPQGLAFDAAGNLYIADHGNNRIRKVTPAGVISTVAGNGTGAFSGDGDLAIYASLNLPRGVFIDGAGNLFIADTQNHRVRKVTPAGVITTVAGIGVHGYGADGVPATQSNVASPYAVLADAAGNIYIGEYGYSRLRKVDAATGIISTLAYVSCASGLSHQDGTVYVTQACGSHNILKFDPATGTTSTVAGSGTPGFSGDGGNALLANFNNPNDVFVDSSFNIYIYDASNMRIRMVSGATGIINTVAGSGEIGDGGPATDAALADPGQVIVDASGRVFINDVTNRRVRVFDQATGIISTYAGNGTSSFSGDGGPAATAGLGSPQAIALDSQGNLHIAGFNRIRKVDRNTGIITTVAGSGQIPHSGDGGPALAAGLTANGVAIDSADNIYISDNYNHRIRKVAAATGIITTIAGSGADEYSGDGGPAVLAGMMKPFAIAVDASQNVYFGDVRTYRVRKIDAVSGIVTTVAGNGVSGYSGDGGPAVAASLAARGICVDAQGNIYTASGGKLAGGAGVVRKIDAVTGVISTVAGGSLTGFSGDGGPAVNALLSRPRGVFVDGAGNIYIADTGNGRIRKVLAPQADLTAPAVTVSPTGRSYSTPQVVTLSASEPAIIYYTTDGSDPVVSATRQSFDTAGQISVSQSMTLRYFPVDRAGNAGIVELQDYQITYQQVLDPAYMSTDTRTLLSSSTRSETAYVSLTTGFTFRFDGYGDFAGENTVTFDRWLHVKTGSFAGWHYGVGHYNFSGRQGTVHFTRYGNEYRMTLLGDIHGALISEGGDLVRQTGSATLYVTSINGAAAPAAVQLYGRAVSEGDGGVAYPETTLSITTRSDDYVLAGYASTSFRMSRDIVAMTVNGVAETFSIGEYNSAEGVGRSYMVTSGGESAAVMEGPIFGIKVISGALRNIEHILASAPLIAAGNTHAAAIKGDGSLWSWGDNSYGQLGLGNTLNSMPKLVLSSMRQVAAGAKHTVAVDSNGTVFAWGANTTGALGTGDNADSTLPRVALTGKSIRSVAAGSGFSLALDLNGGVFAWGDNTFGQLGNGQSYEQSSSSGSVLIPQEYRISAISAGTTHALALDDEGLVWGWGNNGRGQLASGQLAYASLPVRVPQLAMVSAVAAGGEHSLALDFYGNVWSWGANTRGQLGNGGNLDSATPVQVSGLSGVVAIAAGSDHSLALKRDGTVWAWGGNSYGQLGNNDAQKRDSWIPVQMATLSGSPQGGLVSITAGNAFSMAMKYDGTVLSWGKNNVRQLAITHTSGIYYAGLSRMNTADTLPPTVTAEPAGGSFGAPITVTLTSSETTNNTIFYTLDGSDPATSPTRKVASGLSTVSIPISTSCTLRYYAVDGGSNPSQLYSQQYSFNLAPAISGTPAPLATSGTPYSFTPAGSVASGTITYTIANKPAWASFNMTTGALTGTPTVSQVGTYSGIAISAVANGLTAQLAPFSITVTAPALGSATTFVAINGGAPGITGTGVTLSLGCSLGDGCAQMQFSNDDLIWSAPEPFATNKSWMIPPEDGLKTVYVKFLDAAGNPSNTYFSSAILTGSSSAAGSYLFDGKWGKDSSADGKFLLPGAVAWSRGDGAVYVADGQNCRIQKFDSQLNFVTKWGGCGPGDGQFLGLNGLATDSLGNVYVTDARNRVQKFAKDGSFITKWFGTGSATTAVAVDGDDTVYVSGSGYVQVYDRNGQFLRQWSVYQAGSGLAVDARKNVYVRSANSVWQYDSAGRFLLSWTLPYGYNVSGLGNQSGFAFNPYDSSMVVVDAQAHLIRFYSPPDSDAGTEPTQTATYGGYGPGAGQLNRPQHVAFDDSGNMFIADTGNQRVLKLAPPYTGTPIGVGAADTSNGGFNIPVSVAVDPASGNVFVTDLQNDRVQQFSAAGQYLNQFGNSGSAAGQFRVPLDAVPDGRGNLYVLDGLNSRVQKLSVATGEVLASFGGELVNPRRLTLDRNGNVYVAQTNRITKYDQGGALLANWGNYLAATNNSFYATGIALDSHDASDVICVLDASYRRILRFDTDGNYLGAVGQGTLSNMMSLAVDSAGYLYVYDNSVGAINKFDPQGNLVTVWGKKSSVLDGNMKNALGLAVDSYGTVFVADSYNNRIQKFIPAVIPNGTGSINSGSSTTVSRTVDLTLSAQSNLGVVQSMRFSNDNLAWSAWEPYATSKTGWQLPDREGTSYVYIQFRNSYGTVSKTIKCSIMVKYELFTVVTAPVDSYTPVSVTPTADASLQVTFQSVIAATGNSGVQVSAAQTPPPPPADLKVYNSQVYEIQAPGVSFGGTAEVCLAFRPSAVSDPNNMKILHYVDSAWQDITTSRTYNLDNDTGRVCGHTDSFSPFMTGETVTAVDGVCGASNGGTFAAIPTDFLCSTGASSAVSGTGPWNWSCAGTNGGNPASCSADKLAYLEPPVTTASPAGGSYSGNALMVTLSTTNSAVIYYTTNGSTPTTSSAVYSAPLSLSGNVTLKYFARDDSNNVEQVKSAAYSITSATQPSGSFAGTKSGTTFSILRSEGGKAFSTVVASTASTSYTDSSTLKPNTIYQYAVTSDTDPTRTVFMTTRTPLCNGWNIVAVPYSVSGVTPATFFTGGAVGSVYQWLPSGATTEESNSPRGSYATVSGLASGLGYFVKTGNGSTMIGYEGSAGPSATTVVLKPGWTMISNPTATVKSNIATNWLIDGEQLSDAINSNKIGGGIYWWNGTTYDSWSIVSQDPRIEPWKGYWLINLDSSDHTLTIQ